MSVSLRRFQISAFLMNCLRIKVKSSFPPKKSKAPHQSSYKVCPFLIAFVYMRSRVAMFGQMIIA